MQGLIDQQLANTLLAVEGALDAELEKTENLDEDDLARIKANRMAEMKKKAEQTEMNRHNGHGTFEKISDQQEFFAAAKKSDRLIVIFTRNSNKWGQQLCDHCRLICQKHLEAKFVWADAENSPFLTDRLNIYMLPTIVCIKDNKVHKQHNGLNDISGDGKMTTGLIEFLLHIDEMLDDAPIHEKEVQEQEEEDADISDDEY